MCFVTMHVFIAEHTLGRHLTQHKHIHTSIHIHKYTPTVWITELKETILLTKTTAAKNEVALSYHRVRGLYLLAVVFVAPI